MFQSEKIKWKKYLNVRGTHHLKKTNRIQSICIRWLEYMKNYF